MAAAHSVNTIEARAVLCSSDSELPREGLPLPDETSPLLQYKRVQGTKRNLSERWHSARLSASSFIGNNAGLLLVAASQFFFSSMNLSVKWLNSLDEPVPTLELIWVRMASIYGKFHTRCLVRGVSAHLLTFLTPILTGFSGAIFLKEPLSLKEILAGVYSLFGVILIARPQFLFGGLQTDPSGVVSPGQRMVSVSAGLVGVLGATGAYTLIRGIGKRAHIFHAMTFFSSQCVLGSTAGRPLWLAVLLLIGILGFIAQMLLTMGLQRETASRSALAIYISVCLLRSPSLHVCARVDLFPHNTFHTLNRRNGHHYELGHLYLGTNLPLLLTIALMYPQLTKKTAVKSEPGPALEQPALGTPRRGDIPEP
ncbi:hypothetical protein BJV78DRAFT_1157203 [Lactifluus subvellereus]|nr:hypothetical protein BJV78DRAFT_1157203 [Lactifluus subvellereus]